MTRITRRELLALGAMLPGFQGLAEARSLAGFRRRDPTPLQPPAGEPDWEALQQQFVIAGTHLNTGTYGACPIPVLEATIHHLRAFERITRQEHPDLDALHASLERFLGAWPGSVAIVRNTTEAINVVAHGMTLAEGDEVLMTSHEHIGGHCAWEMLAARRGTTCRTFDPPLDPTDPDALHDAWVRAIGPRTRVLLISHVLFSTGMIQPVAQLVRTARARGMVSVIDGAHPPGMLQLDLTALDADYYATSPHKWLLAPKGTGLLITRPDRLTTTWPLIASGDWERDDHRRFEHVGTSNESLVAGLAAAVQFQEAIGRAAIERRARSLATALYGMLAEVKGVRLVSPRNEELRSAMVSFTKDGVGADRLQGALGAAGFRTRRISEFGYEYLRLSTHLYVLPRDLERAVEVIAGVTA
ncbi:MAG TPA: aminotransferase class V-fold PLP-dependent enzyme [Gemmatimonadales bacterium]|nr:aminotransferase class V-fold PLP-dependent enzyme [Gemmatimonadales bacterium]